MSPSCVAKFSARPSMARPGTKQRRAAAAGSDLAAGVCERAGFELLQSRRLCSLWAGYGTISEVEARDEDGKAQRLILKEVHPAGGSANAGSVSHMRKVRSYMHEAYFYQHLAPRLEHTGARVPCCLHAENSLDESHEGGRMAMLLEDLRPAYPRSIGGALTLAQAKVVLTWLASLHAAFWQQPLPTGEHGVWEQGCYWHLATRQEEFESMGRDWAALKAAAAAIDARLRQPDASDPLRFKTLVHGDTKSDNLLFAEDLGSCAGVDFQYAGSGLGVSDVAYALVSNVDSRTLEGSVDELLQHYHQQLTSQLKPAAAADYTRIILDQHFDLALLDYVRFMAGWGAWGYGSGWAQRKAKQLLKELSFD